MSFLRNGARAHVRVFVCVIEEYMRVHEPERASEIHVYNSELDVSMGSHGDAPADVQM